MKIKSENMSSLINNENLKKIPEENKEKIEDLREKLTYEKRELNNLKDEIGIGDDGIIPTELPGTEDEIDKKYYPNAKENREQAIKEYYERLDNIKKFREDIRKLGGTSDISTTQLEQTKNIQQESLN